MSSSVLFHILTGCLFAVLHTDCKKCCGFVALHAGRLTSRVKRRQHSFRYRSASVRVVMVGAQKSCYLRSAENGQPTQNTLKDLCSHASDTQELHFDICPQVRL